MNCSNINESVTTSGMYCSSLSWGVAYANGSHEGNCRAENYTGFVCRQQLMIWQDCVLGGEHKDVFLDLTLMELSQEERERDAAQFLHFLCQLYLCIQGRIQGGGPGGHRTPPPPWSFEPPFYSLTRDERRTIERPNRHFERSLIQETINVGVE